MSRSIGTATFSDGTTSHFEYCNTSGYVVSGLTNTDKFPQKNTPTNITNQPLLAQMFVDYGKGITWSSWCTHDKKQILFYFDEYQHYDWNLSYAMDINFNVHIISEYSGFGFSFDEPLCKFDAPTMSVETEYAEGRLCLNCVNKFLKREL